MCVLIRRKVLLRRAEEGKHTVRQGLGIADQRWHAAQQGAVQRAVDLEERRVRWVRHPHHGHMAQQARRQRRASGIRGRVAGADDLDALESNPRALPPESALLDPLAHQCEHMLRSVPIWRRQVDLVAKESQTAARHTRHEPTTCWRVLVHGMRLEGAQQRAWCRLR